MEYSELESLVSKYQAEQRIDEVVWFYDHCKRLDPKVIVEIGIKEGGNLKVLSTLLPPDGIAVGIDPRKEIPWKMDDAMCTVHHIPKNSHLLGTAKALKKILKNRKVDILFIDGDHSRDGMLQDFRDYSPFVRKGGIIAVHDIFYLKDVAEAWASIKGTKFESSRNQSSIGIGFVYKEEE